MRTQIGLNAEMRGFSQHTGRSYCLTSSYVRVEGTPAQGDHKCISSTTISTEFVIIKSTSWRVVSAEAGPPPYNAAGASTCSAVMCFHLCMTHRPRTHTLCIRLYVCIHSTSDITLKTMSGLQSKQKCYWGLTGLFDYAARASSCVHLMVGWEISEWVCRCLFVICELLSDTKAQQERLVLSSADVN